MASALACTLGTLTLSLLCPISFLCHHYRHPLNKVMLETRDKRFPAPGGAPVWSFLPKHRTLPFNLGRYEPVTNIKAIPVSHCCVVSSLIARIVATAYRWLGGKWLCSVVALFKELFFWQIMFSSAKIKCCQCYWQKTDLRSEIQCKLSCLLA